MIEAFQKTMQMFLDVQRDTMLGYLQGAGPGTAESIVEFGPSPRLGPVSSNGVAGIDLAHDPHDGPVRNGHASRSSSPTQPSPTGAVDLDLSPSPLAGEGWGGGSNRSAHASQASPQPAIPGRDDLAARLLAIVRERTGYPAEMLRLDLDLEADLGIDSIKRVEILGSLRDAFPGLGLESDSGLMDELSRARTLGAIVGRVVESPGLSGSVVGPGGHPPVAPAQDRPTRTQPSPTRGESLFPSNSPSGGEGPFPAPSPPVGEGRGGGAPGPQPGSEPSHDEPGAVRRLTLEVVEAPLPDPSRATGLATGGLVLVTDDGRGIARALAFDLRAKGHPVVRVGHGASPGGGVDPDREWIDLTSPAEVSACLGRLRRRGPLAGIVHALPLRDGPAAGLDPSAWALRMGPEVRGLFLLARDAADDLARAAGQGGACLVAATAMGGAFASAGRAPRDFFPGHGAVAGLVKTIAREWPRSVRARVVDLDPGDPVEILAANLVQEVGGDDGRAEVGYLDRRRVALRARPADLPGSVDPAFELAEGEPVVVTGGRAGSPRRSPPTWPAAGGPPCCWSAPARCRPTSKTPRRPASAPPPR